ncbi:unnamed protein product [Rodentolepis nana]|uniref:G-patch domain-containing protein n=1 Tax=Rodentolepis nana TaxID=102285 RepID=A0A0R3TFX1_RODNA|nr:unnamed protein product [Rodentolepis nana]
MKAQGYGPGRLPDLKVQRTQSSNNRETVDSGTLRHSRLRESKPLLSLDYVSDSPHNEGLNQERIHVKDNNGLIRREFQTSRCNELKARTKEK